MNTGSKEVGLLTVTHRGTGTPLVFLHGWPDDPTLWDGLASRFESDHCCIRVQLPAFPGSDAERGADFPVLADQLEAQLASLLGDTRAVFAGHDWGAILTYLFAQRHPGRIERLVTLDVGGQIQPSVAEWPIFVGYQGWLIAAEAAGRFAPRLGDRMARWMAHRARAPHPERVTARMGYPYRYAWRAILIPGHRDSLARRFRPSHPLLFIYGTRKPFPFHSRSWIETLEADPDCEVVGVDATHWVMLDREDEVAEAIAAFIGR